MVTYYSRLIPDWLIQLTAEKEICILRQTEQSTILSTLHEEKTCVINLIAGEESFGKILQRNVSLSKKNILMNHFFKNNFFKYHYLMHFIHVTFELGLGPFFSTSWLLSAFV